MNLIISTDPMTFRSLLMFTKNGPLLIRMIQVLPFVSGRKSSTGSEFTWYKTINVHIIPANITSFVSMLLLKMENKKLY